MSLRGTETLKKTDHNNIDKGQNLKMVEERENESFKGRYLAH